MLPEHSPFSPEQRRTIDGLIASFSPAQRFWLGGYLSAGEAAKASVVAPAAATKLQIVYGSESGNAEKLANGSAKDAKKRGFAPVVKNMADITPADLAKVENLLVIVSTWGDGEPPETATAFYKALMSETVDLAKVKFSVCALGDTSYEKFCQTGKDIDARLETLGARRVLDRRDCDVDYDAAHTEWLGAALAAFGPSTVATAQVVESFAEVAESAFNKQNPFSAELTERVLLNGKGSRKETWHYEFSLEGSGLNYEPGDSLGVFPVNAPDVIEGILKASKLKGNETVVLPGKGERLLFDALREELDITALSRPVLEKLQAATGSKKLATLLDEKSKDKLKDYLYGRWIADAIRDYAAKGIGATELVGILRKMPPRLYSISSSPLAHPGEVHLTVASVRYESQGQARKGVASTYLADLVKPGEKVAVYTNENKQFRLPQSGDTPIIMVGPGTGVAPFRAFVEHRAALEQRGKNWLVFGDQQYLYDFLYQVEWQDHLASKSLTKLDVAFSRDQPEKVYVQHRLAERAKELYAWLEEGAHFYVCGDATRMAHDVHEALIAAVQTAGAKSREAAESYVEDLKKSKRYQRDVY
jgi:sulfite reductase (NADPH) flavoprotein alpha-component